MYEVLRVKVLNAQNHLHSDYQDIFQSEIVLAEGKQLVEVGPENRHDQHSVVTLDAEPIDSGYSS